MIREVSFACAVALAYAAQATAVEPGQPAPNCALGAVAGAERYELSEFQGSVLWVDFWASWCGKCADAFAFLDDLDRELGAQGFRVLGINLDEERQDAMSFLAKHPVGFAQAADPDGVCPRRFGVEAMPAAYLVDRRGFVRHVHLGFRAGETESLRALVQALIAEEHADEAD
jgi:thiol-disulfide isomerase/thioredoxin